MYIIIIIIDNHNIYLYIYIYIYIHMYVFTLVSNFKLSCFALALKHRSAIYCKLSRFYVKFIIFVLCYIKP